MKYILKIILGFAIYNFTISSIQAVKVISPQLPTYPGINSADITSAWNSILSSPEVAALNKYDNQVKLAKGFANANEYAANAASLDGYQDYSLFAIMSGVVFSAQLPSHSISINNIKKMRNKIEEEGDVYAGAGIVAGIINAGINAGFIYPGLYINLKFGYLSLNGKNISGDLNGYNYKNMLLGIGINQVIFWPRNLVPGTLRWRGISIGTGFYYSKTRTNVTILKSLITGPIPNTTDTLILDPAFTVEVSTITMTVPIEVNTSVKFFQVLNFNLGTGADFNYGSSEIKLKAAGSITVQDSGGNTLTPTTPGSVTMEGGTKKQKPSYINPKIIAGLGFNIGLVKIDIPFTYYYLESGFAIGLSAGVIW